jgi:SagB-type dehydrogenase family enzyme
MTGEVLRAYHERTKHTPRSVRETAHFLDWRNEPSRFKRYRGLEAAAFPSFEPTGVPAHEAVAASARPDGGAALDLDALSHLLFHAAGVSRTIRSEMGEFHFRTYASAGALYPIEVYVIAGDVERLDPGVYHYAPLEHGLTLLRTGDFRGSAGLAGAAPGAATVMLTGVPWRTEWKYTARGFRHLYWDAGMVLANLLTAAAALRLRARVHLGFVDGAANEVLAVDGVAEFALCAVAVGEGDAPAVAEVPPLDLEVEPVAPRPQHDPLIEEAHRAIELSSEDEVLSFRGNALEDASIDEAEDEELFPPVTSLSAGALASDPIEEVIRRRGSSRLLARESFPAPEMAAILDRAMAGVPGDWLGGTRSVRTVVMAAALSGLPPGIHHYRPSGRFRLRREGSFRGEAGYLCLEQRLGADAAAVTFLLADLDSALTALGGRGYAAAQLEAAIVAGRVYLGAYAQCLGTSGITFYDDDIRRFLETDLEPMLVVVTGPEGRRTSIRRCRKDLERS